MGGWILEAICRQTDTNPALLKNDRLYDFTCTGQCLTSLFYSTVDSGSSVRALFVDYSKAFENDLTESTTMFC